MTFDNQATYYDAGGIETINIIKAKLTKEQFEGWLLGNCIKYNCRANFKGTKQKDFHKAQMYAKKLVELEKGKADRDPRSRKCSTCKYGYFYAMDLPCRICDIKDNNMWSEG